MSTLLKDIYTINFSNNFGNKVHTVYRNFDTKQFINSVSDHLWDKFPLKVQIHRISETLGEYLPKDFEAALQILFSINESCTRFPYLFLPDFVEIFGQHQKYSELSMTGLE